MKIEESGKTPFGQRLAEARRRAGYANAQVLADAIKERYGDDEARVTKATIANLETGRKGDVGALELVQIAATLKVSPLLLLLDMERPFDSVDWLPLSGMTNLEAFQWFTVADADSELNINASEMAVGALDHLRELETSIMEVERVANRHAERVARALRYEDAEDELEALRSDFMSDLGLIEATMGVIRSSMRGLTGVNIPSSYSLPSATKLWEDVKKRGQERHANEWAHN